MAITSYGYPGAIVPGLPWAQLQQLLGRQAMVPGKTDWEPSVNGSVARTVRMAPGMLGGDGILDSSSAPEDVALPDPGAGNSRYYLVGANRKWGATNATTPGYVAGTAERKIPAYLKDPGVEAFRPVALARITGGGTAVTDLVDLRAIAKESGVYTIFDDLALQLIEHPGVVAYNANTKITRRRVYSTSGNTWVWERVYEAQAIERPYLCVRRLAAFSGTVTSGSVPFYAGREQDHIKKGDWSTHLEYSNGAGGAASPVSQTAPAYIRTKTSGVYAYGAYVDMTSETNNSTMAFSVDVDQDNGTIDPYHQNYVLAGERVMWTLTNTLWLPAGSRLHPSFGKASGPIQLHRWWMWMTRLSD